MMEAENGSAWVIRGGPLQGEKMVCPPGGRAARKASGSFTVGLPSGAAIPYTDIMSILCIATHILLQCIIPDATVRRFRGNRRSFGARQRGELVLRPRGLHRRA